MKALWRAVVAEEGRQHDQWVMEGPYPGGANRANNRTSPEAGRSCQRAAQRECNPHPTLLQEASNNRTSVSGAPARQWEVRGSTQTDS